ncbi:hypothetical protein EVJ58_g7737 [Rhodofomes roseus]|uniref:Uncharacterized protein n=1 Tax=Rhodofomes roseus TaxID=34475 RepID=A0A4Y9Y3C7_9APHY|nr:hypothetical protein EVJ58_g7737 [Rhodofomes roseus]
MGTRTRVVTSAPAGRGRRVRTSKGVKQLESDKVLAAQKQALLRSGLTTQSKRILDELQGTKPAVEDLDVAMDVDLVVGGTDIDEWIDEVDDEGTFAHALRDILDSTWKPAASKYSQTWRQRLERSDHQWRGLMPELIDAYLEWRHPPSEFSTPASTTAPLRPRATSSPPSGASVPSAAGASVQSPLASAPSIPPDLDSGSAMPPNLPSVSSNMQSSPDLPGFGQQADAGEYDFSIDVFNIQTLQQSVRIRCPADMTSGAKALVLHGYLGTSPTKPSLAIALETLEHLRRIRLFCASYSVEAFTKLLCYYYKIPFRRRFRLAVADAYDVYLGIIRAVRSRVRAALAEDGPNWRVLNACPACSFELEDEPALRWSRMFCLDGNNSLKRMAPTEKHKRGDMRVLDDSDYFLSHEYVDTFAHEVKSRGRRVDADESESEETPVSRPQIGADPDDGDPSDAVPDDSPLASCTRNWKAAAGEAQKKMWGIFDESGIFAGACPHGLILWLADMVKSGELAKYPLSMTAKALDVFEGAHLEAYDIGCSYGETIRRSRLGAEFKRRQCRSCVNTFHGYTHNIACQCTHHPNVIDGMGLDDLETLERIFSASNHLASITRYATPYRRRLLIEQYFQQWDDEKYAYLSQHIYDRLVQANEIITTEALPLAEMMAANHVDLGTVHHWYKEEREYFQTLGKEVPWDVHAMAYVEALQELQVAQENFNKANGDFLASVPDGYHFLPPSDSPIVDYNKEASRTRRLETEKRILRERLQSAENEVAALEVQMGITKRWQASDAEYSSTVQYVSQRKYHRALDKLQGLVVQRLFELHKLNLQHTAYKVRTHIAKALQRRCKAIRNAVKAYNAAAVALDPPRPTVDWEKVSHYSFLDEFSLLCDTRDDVRKKPWATSSGREIIRRSRRIERAREQVVRSCVEARRLYSSIAEENARFMRIIENLAKENSPVLGPVIEYVERRTNAHARHLVRLRQIEALPAFDVSFVNMAVSKPRGPGRFVVLGGEMRYRGVRGVQYVTVVICPSLYAFSDLYSPGIARGDYKKPLPVIITCETDEEAARLAKLQPFFDLAGQSLDPEPNIVTGIALSLLTDEDAMGICQEQDAEHTRAQGNWEAYTIVQGDRCGVYTHWAYVEPNAKGDEARAIGGGGTKYAGFKSMANAIVWYLYKGGDSPDARRGLPPIVQAVLNNTKASPADLISEFADMTLSSDQPGSPPLTPVRPRPRAVPSRTPTARISSSARSASTSRYYSPATSIPTPSSPVRLPPYATPSRAPGQTASTNRTRSAGDYIIVRTLPGALPVPTDVDIPTLGLTADDYVWRHGWDNATQSAFVHAYHSTRTKQDFVKHLMLQGAPGAEMEYLHELIAGHQ